MAFVSHPLVHQVIGCDIAVHRELGPGLLESTYGRCFRIELSRQGIKFTSELLVPIIYLKLSGARQGLLINFNSSRLKDGIKSVLLREGVSSSASSPSTAERE